MYVPRFGSIATLFVPLPLPRRRWHLHTLVAKERRRKAQSRTENQGQVHQFFVIFDFDPSVASCWQLCIDLAMWALGVAAVLGGAAVAAATPSSVIAWSSEPRYALLSPHLVRVSARTQAPNFCQFPKSALGERREQEGGGKNTLVLAGGM